MNNKLGVFIFICGGRELISLIERFIFSLSCCCTICVQCSAVMFRDLILRVCIFHTERNLFWISWKVLIEHFVGVSLLYSLTSSFIHVALGATQHQQHQQNTNYHHKLFILQIHHMVLCLFFCAYTHNFTRWMMMRRSR